MPHLKTLFHSPHEDEKNTANRPSGNNLNRNANKTTIEPKLLQRATSSLFHSTKADNLPSPLIAPSSQRTHNGKISLTRASSFLLGSHHKNSTIKHDNAQTNIKGPTHISPKSHHVHNDNEPPKPLPSIDTVKSKRKNTLTYNPYGLNSTIVSPVHAAGELAPSLSNHPSNYSRQSTAINLNIHNNNSIASIYSESTGEYLLPLPILDPNVYLPCKLHEYSVDLYDGYQLPEKFSSKNKKLGGGTSSAVRTVVEKENHGNVYALKKFRLFKKETSEEFYKRCSREFVIAVSLSNYHHIVNTSKLVKVPTIHDLTRGWGFILEYCPQGDLFDLILKPSFKHVDFAEKYCLFKQVALGIKFMHDNDVAHRDLKPENVLVADTGELKLTDFGVSIAGHTIPGDFNSPIQMCASYVGSPPYSPPEVMQLKHESNSPHVNMFSTTKKIDKKEVGFGYDPFKMDLWSLGILLFVIIQQLPPFNEASKIDHFYRDYLALYASFMFKHPNFKTEKKHKGPLENYKLGKIFKGNGDASRVAWRLADPDCETRYTMEDLFLDEWFLKLEMCCEEKDEIVLVETLKEKGYDSGGLIRDHNELLNCIAVGKQAEKNQESNEENNHAEKESKDEKENFNDKKEIKDEEEAKDVKEDTIDFGDESKGKIKQDMGIVVLENNVHLEEHRSKESPTEETKSKESYTKEDKSKESYTKENKLKESYTKEDKNQSYTKEDKSKESYTKEDKSQESHTEENKSKESQTNEERSRESDDKKEFPGENHSDANSAGSPYKSQTKNLSEKSKATLLLSNTVRHLNEIEKLKHESALEDKLLAEEKRKFVLSFKKDIKIDRERYCLGPIKKHHHVL